jgi:hypothetical protein
MGERDEDVLGRYSKINGSKSQQASKEIDDFFIMDEIDPKNDEANKDQVRLEIESFLVEYGIFRSCAFLGLT